MKNEWPKIIKGFPAKFGLSFEHAEWFTDENNHNPLVIPNCPNCLLGKVRGEYRGPNMSIGHLRCESCGGTGIDSTSEPVLLYDNEIKPIALSCNETGHVRCPKCGCGFQYYDKRSFSGMRHGCGQILVIDTEAHLKI